jgi:hypothetical protein
MSFDLKMFDWFRFLRIGDSVTPMLDSNSSSSLGLGMKITFSLTYLIYWNFSKSHSSKGSWVKACWWISLSSCFKLFSSNSSSLWEF